ncbi:homeodomain-only protein-like [Anneissia japonica]|uniref:homeodomain-only protein-like n=1 Tax=Anneissia japonica TaxID=1529436 RepID=UPI0014255367|nr:homeodomain-only protein-like [Anneissia japonica]
MESLPTPSRVVEAKLVPEKEKVKLSATQENILESNFKQSKNIDDIMLEIIAAEAGLSVKDTEKWFQNRIALWRKQEGLAPSSGFVA